MTILSPDGHRIAYIESGSNNETVLLMCHGITVNKSENGTYDDFAAKAESRGWNTFRFDFRGHGQSEVPANHTTITGMILDLYTVVDYLKSKYKNIYFLGTSFGASIFLLYAKKFPIDIVRKACFWNPVIDYASTFTNTDLAWGSSFFPQGGVECALKESPVFIGRRRFEANANMVLELFYYAPQTLSWAKELPLVILHGVNDTMVSYQASKKYAEENSGSNVQLYTYQASHGLTEEREKVFSDTLKFLFDE